MPKMTSTPTASSERTRLCAPVMPVTGAGTPGRAAVSTPDREAAASRVGDSGAASRRAGRATGSLGVVVISGGLLGRAEGRAVPANGGCQQKTPRAAGTEGSARRSGTGALGDYEDVAETAVGEQAEHPHTVRPRRSGRQPRRPIRWTPGAGDLGCAERAPSRAGVGGRRGGGVRGRLAAASLVDA